ncbi:alpha/beta hydrolase [Lachnospiraceae bacterium 54-53]
MKLKEYKAVAGRYDLQNDGTCFYDIAYSDFSEKNRLDLYLPKIKKESYPLVVFIHGGAFAKSDKGRHIAGVLNSLQLGCAVASMNYRLNDEVRYPDMLKDCIDAVRFLAKRPETDSEKIILWGETHGGYLACDMGINHHQDETYKLAGVISYYAPIDLYDYHKRQMASGRLMEVNGVIVDEASFGASGDELLDILKKQDLLHKIDGSEPAFYLLHGKKDDSIPIEYSIRLAEALKEKQVDCVLDLVEDGTHGIDFYAAEKYNLPVMEFIGGIVGDTSL